MPKNLSKLDCEKFVAIAPDGSTRLFSSSESLESWVKGLEAVYPSYFGNVKVARVLVYVEEVAVEETSVESEN